MDTGGSSPPEPPTSDVVGMFRSLSAGILEIANRGPPRDTFVTEVLDVLLASTGVDRASLRLPHGKELYGWTRVCGEAASIRPWVVPVTHETVAEPDGNAWRRLLPSNLAGSTQLGTVWTRREGLDALAGLGPEERPLHLRDVAAAPSSVSVLLVPVVVGASSAGLLQLESRAANAFDPAWGRVVEGAAQILGAALVTQSARWALQERVKELSCLYEIARLTERVDVPLDEVLGHIAAALPSAWQFPEITSTRIVLDGREILGPGPRPVRTVQSAVIRTNGDRRGLVEVGYAEERPPEAEGPFLTEERSLLDAIATEIGNLLDRRGAAEERMRLERQLQHSDRLATIGQLAAGVAHELNEPLGAILGFAQLTAKVQSLPSGVGEDVDRIVQAALHARGIVRKLMLFGRQSTAHTEQVDLGLVVENGLYFLAARCALSSISLEREIVLGECIVEADGSQIYQVIVNLVVNAIQAMPAGGRLVVRTQQVGGEAQLDVTDTGSGMTPKVREMIFTPFFTTKEVGEGTGLGLSVVHGIVTEHGGTIDVESHLGKGSRFTIRLPLAAEPRGEAS